MLFTGQPQDFPSSSSAGLSSIIMQMPPGTKAFEMPTSSTAAQIQHQMMELETEQGPIQVPVETQAASKAQDEKRKRNATASLLSRQRRKEREQETSNKIAKLETQVRKTEEDRDYFPKEDVESCISEVYFSSRQVILSKRYRQSFNRNRIRQLLLARADSHLAGLPRQQYPCKCANVQCRRSTLFSQLRPILD